MAAVAAADHGLRLRSLLAVGTHRVDGLPKTVEWFEASHPLPDPRSVAAGRRAAEIAGSVGSGECLLILLSGGASALLAAPAGISLDDKRRTIELMMHTGADITELNTVRKHLSALKGGQLAAACAGTTVTLAVSDVVGDDVSVIGSGPGVPDESTWARAAQALDRRGGSGHPDAVRARIALGLAGRIPDTPKPGDPRLARATGFVVGNRADAVEGARRAAIERGYQPVVLDRAIEGEAREAALDWFAAATGAASEHSGRVCVISGGETTVRVTGDGTGGRNQEFALALARTVERSPRRVAAASVGTDGIHGPTDAAGALVDETTMLRAAHAGLRDPASYLDRNNSYVFFDTLDDLIRTGRTDTNVGDLQILLIDS
jgi:glycerate-2-kinase